MTSFQLGHRYIKTDSKSQNENEIVVNDKYPHPNSNHSVTQRVIAVVCSMSLITRIP